jgi:hypothetical protein
MNKGDILIYVGENNKEYKKGNKVEFSKELGQARLPYDDENYLLVIIKSSPNLWKTLFGIVKSKDFVDLKTFRNQRIDTLL